MHDLSKRFVVGGLAAAVMASAFVTAASATVIVDPSTLSRSQRAHALTSPLRYTDPFGQPVTAGCQWSRIQVPGPGGLHWVDLEDCQSKN